MIDVSSLNKILTIVFSSIIGASASMIMVILAERRYANSFYEIFWSIKVHFFIILCLTILLIILSRWIISITIQERKDC